jgi:imidazolonepropionase
MPVLVDIGCLYRCLDGGKQSDVHMLENAAVAWEDGIITWVGPQAGLPAQYAGALQHSAGGSPVIPGLVDCHTHLAFGGWRADEFELRSRGATYQEIARAGGGIRSTMRATRAAGEEELAGRAGRFLGRMLDLGVTTVEAKSGYGLTFDGELKLLSVYRRLAEVSPVQLVSTLLGAHVVPPEFEGDRGGYVTMICERMVPAAAQGLASFCDVFVEDGAFTADEARVIFEAGRAYGLRPKLHVDQLTDGAGGLLAAEVGAASADHLEYTSAEGMAAMAEAGVVAVTLPIASLYLRQPPMRARAFLDVGCDVAVATDFNPGSAPSYHLPWAMTLACTMNGMTPHEALKGATAVAARAIGMESVCGSVAVGKRADLVILEAESVNHWLYHAVPNAAQAVFVGGIRMGG